MAPVIDEVEVQEQCCGSGFAEFRAFDELHRYLAEALRAVAVTGDHQHHPIAGERRRETGCVAMHQRQVELLPHDQGTRLVRPI